MCPTGPLSRADLADLCVRAFPDRAGQTLVDVLPVPSRQHQVIGFDLWWMNDDGILRHEALVARRYRSTLSWWRPDDRGKAQREVAVCRWLHQEGFPAPAVYWRQFGPEGDTVLFSRLPGQPLAQDVLSLREIVEPYSAGFARLLARLHSLTPPDEVRAVVPEVTLVGAIASLTAVAYQVGDPDLTALTERVMGRAYDVVEARPVLVHGDYHLLNALLEDQDITGVVDWEYAALGDPRWDVANAYMQLVGFGAAQAADRFLETYLRVSGRQFEGPPLHNVVTTLQQWAISELMVRQQQAGSLPDYALAQDLVAQRDLHRQRAELTTRWMG